MTSLVQIAAPASKNAMATADNPSTASASSAGDKEGDFSSHLKAQQDGNRHATNEPARERSGSNGESTAASPQAADAGSDEGDDSVASSVTDKGRAASSHDRQGSSATGAEIVKKSDSQSSNGLQNTLVKDLGDQVRALPLATMGEQVEAVLGADDLANLEPATRIDPLSTVTGGNELPPEDGLLPPTAVEGLPDIISEETGDAVHPALALGGTEPGRALTEDELLAAADQQIAAAVSQPQAAVLQPGSAVSRSQSEALLSQSSPTLSKAMPELLRSAQGKQNLVLNEALDSEADSEAGIESDLTVSIGKTLKGSLLESTTPKLPVTPPLAAEVLSNGSGSKDTFEQVRQSIMATLAGKSEAQNSVNLAVSSGSGIHEVLDTPTQGLNVASGSAALAATGAESAKYAAAQESASPRFFTLQTPAGQPGWDVEVGNRIRWMVGQNNSGVELRLNPRELGSIEVKVATEGERTSVTFFAANPAARETLELALPRLREMFADSGMQLANADVSDQSFQQAREQLSGSEGFSVGGDSGESMILEAGPGLVPQGQPEGRSVIDYYI